MARHRHIRFFISSTFKDMDIERNLLTQVFENIQHIYAQKGWLIEYIDLRWGISSKASQNNKTMSICINELKRCQSLSPKPNFLILLGERYGWVPLPETIAYEDACKIKDIATQKELQFFNKWYKLDLNEKPYGIYILQPQKNAPKILLDLMKRYGDTQIKYIYNCFGRSATEQEIQHGALSSNNANEHVIAYIRTLLNVPRESQNYYYESDNSSKELLKSLKERLYSHLDSEKIYDIMIDHSNLKSLQFRLDFINWMTEHITSVIENSILEYNNTQLKISNKSYSHLKYAKELYTIFIGRQHELNNISQYIFDVNRNKPLLIVGDSGMGKSSLLAEIINRHQSSHDIICRFCGIDIESSYDDSLLCSIWEELNCYNNTKNELPISSELKYISRYSTEELFRLRFANMVLNKPLLIIIDAIDTLKIHKISNLLDFKWIQSLSRNLKIIISSTKDISNTGLFDSKIQLNGLNGNSMDLINTILSKNNRKLTNIQYNITLNAINNSNKSPLYLSIIAKYLIKIPSYCNIEKLPIDLKSLIESILENLTNENCHEIYFLRKSLSLLAFDRVGLTHSEINQILSLDANFMDAFTKNVYHKWDLIQETRDIPPILWSRLYDDISYLIGQNNLSYGVFSHFIHKELNNIIISIFCPTAESKFEIIQNLATYYMNKWNVGNNHALSEVAYVCYLAIAYSEDKSKYLQKLQNLLYDINFISAKSSMSKIEYIKDLDFLFNAQQYLYTNYDSYISNLKKDVLSAPYNTADKIKLWAVNLHKDSPLGQLARKQLDLSRILLNNLSSVQPYSISLYSIYDDGEIKYISNDGLKVLSLYKNKELRIISYNKGIQSFAIKFQLINIDVDANLDNVIFLSKEGISILNIKQQKVILSNCDIVNATWVSISSDGVSFAYGGQGGIRTNHYFFKWNTTSGKISDSGKYLWVVHNNNLFRIDLLINSCIHIPIDNNYNNILISSCSDVTCVVFIDNYIIKIDILLKNGTYKYNKNNIGCLFEHTKSYCYENSVLINYANGEFLLYKNDNTFISSGFLGKNIYSKNLSYFYSGKTHSIYDSNLANKYCFIPYDNFNGGINSISSDSSGNIISVSCGINNVQDLSLPLIVINNGSLLKLFNNHRLITTSCISPNSKYIVASCLNHNKQNSIGIIKTDDMVETFFHIDCSCSASIITEDSKYIIAVHGHFIASPDPIIYVFNTLGKQLLKFDKFKNGIFSIKNDIKISANNRYAILSDLNDSYIIDLIDNKIVGHTSFNSTHFPNYIHSFFSINFVTLHPFLGIITKQMQIFDLKTGAIKYSQHNKSIIACTYTGRYLFALNNNNDLFKFNIITLEETYIINNVVCVFPTFNEKHIFVLKNDGIISFIDIFNNIELQKTCIDGCYHYKITAQGLALVDKNGNIALFSPSNIYTKKVPTTATIVKRWNLETRIQDEDYTALCPLCGNTHIVDKGIVNHIKINITKIKANSWEDPILQNVKCPNCNGLLHYNPFLI